MSDLLIRELADLWEYGESPPDIVGFLRQHDSVSTANKLGVLQTDQQFRWRTDRPLRVEDYLAAFPELGQPSNSRLELAVGEYQARLGTYSEAGIDEFALRFPYLAEELSSRLSSVEALDTSESNDAGQDCAALVAAAHLEPGLDSLPTEAWRNDAPTTLIGKFRTLPPLGQGAFGHVWLGFDDELRRAVAIKVPAPERFKGPRDAEMYLAEARTLATLDHSNIVPVYEVGRENNGSIYIVSKFIEGPNLEQLMEKARPDTDQSARLIEVVAGAVHHAHQKQIIHRDIKPANILIDEQTQQPYVADFGLAISEHESLSPASQGGTPSYMSPEQARGEGHRLDGRSDVFALGVVIYELLTGKQPFRGSTAQEIMAPDHFVKSPYGLTRWIPAIPAELERICLKALSKQSLGSICHGRRDGRDLQSLRQRTSSANPQR